MYVGCAYTTLIIHGLDCNLWNVIMCVNRFENEYYIWVGSLLFQIKFAAVLDLWFDDHGS